MINFFKKFTSKNTNQTKIIDIPEVGPVLFKKSNRAKRINISIREISNIRVSVPFNISFESAEQFVCLKTDWIRNNLKKISKNKTKLEEVDKNYARKILKQRLDQLCEKHNFLYGNLSIRNQKTRWGSCSAKNNISLNAKLTSLPKELMDYVILHELVHTRVKNHSKDFWGTLDKYVQNSKKIDKKLKKYSL
ncbi:M48 family metallopeptidase [bacterium]|nr:M48 family metallopeptidase [bacterium]